MALVGCACMAGGAAITTSVYTVSSVVKDRITGSNTSKSDFNAGLVESAYRGVMAGAIVFSMIAYPPARAVVVKGIAGGGTAIAASTVVSDTLISVIPQVSEIVAVTELTTQGVKAMMSEALSKNGGEVSEDKEGVYIEEGEEGVGSQGLIGHDFEDYLTDTVGGNGSFSVGGREFDGGIGNRWWEAKSGNYWNMLEENPSKLAKFKSDMGDRLRIATENGATYEVFSNTPIPDSIKQWLTKKGIPFTELLD